MRHLLKIILLTSIFLGLALVIKRFGSQEMFVFFLSFWIFVQILYMVVDRSLQETKMLKLKKEALQAELLLLKSQINPHFFFNTLNNLYALARIQAKQTPDLIYQLSELMRFTLYEGKKDKVPLADEVSYLENYVNLQAIRTRQQRLDLRFEKQVEDDQIMIPPMFFIMLVENAFKHGVSTTEKDAFVHMNLEATRTKVTFSIENSFSPRDHMRTGMGLSNLKRRLELLFPDKHTYSHSQKGGIYRAMLKVDL